MPAGHAFAGDRSISLSRRRFVAPQILRSAN